ncbi:MAG: cobalamin-dependent protein, partial [Clostridia bacterium]|nr:cobalamin-dependent protein [Clostridia bacterium]
MVQIGVSFVSPVFLPYGTGCIAAYLKQNKEIMSHFHIPDIIVMREKPQEVINRFVHPDFVAFSCYSWNIEYNKVVAKMLKERFPRVQIIFAGHQISPDGATLKELDFVDYLMHNEGEETTERFLEALIYSQPLSTVPNLSYREGDDIITTRKYIPTDISNYPSPYLSGVFDNLMKEFPDREFHATLETNRGCPYSCAYCEWCFTKRVRPFPMEKVKKEIE